MTEEPYRWLEAIGNRREYIREQLKAGAPVFGISRPEGILLLGVGQGQTKVFEIYDRLGFAALGHPVDIEKLRQGAIEAAHMEGFNRSSRDVTLRRLVNFALSPLLKNSFEAIFSPPLMVESVFAELGRVQQEDLLVRMHFDGNQQFEKSGIAVVFTRPEAETQARDWLMNHLQPGDSLARVVSACLAVWEALTTDKPIKDLTLPEQPVLSLPGKIIEAGWLDRQAHGPAFYRPLDLASLPK